MHFLKSWILAPKFRNIIQTWEVVRSTLNNESILVYPLFHKPLNSCTKKPHFPVMLFFLEKENILALARHAYISDLMSKVWVAIPDTLLMPTEDIVDLKVELLP